MRTSNWPVTKDDAGISEQNGCRYCHALFGDQHAASCITRNRSVRIRIEIDMVVSVPEDWGQGQIEFHFGGGGSYCMSNVLDLLNGMGEHRCLCPYSESKYLGEADEDETREWASTDPTLQRILGQCDQESL